MVFKLGSRHPWELFASILGSREILIKIFIVASIFYISYMEPLFVLEKIIGSLCKNDSFCFKYDYDHCSTVAFGNARITLCGENVLCL